MKHAIIRAHPARDSLNAAIAQAYTDAARRHGHTVIERDLYAIRQ
jgi:NAD(P)H dehydrogenase (quinone)